MRSFAENSPLVSQAHIPEHFPDAQALYQQVDKELTAWRDLPWGDFCELYTPAFWKYLHDTHPIIRPSFSNKIGETIVEEVVACMLGGFGIPSEIGIAAFHRVKSQNLIRRDVTYSELLTALSLPLELPGGKSTVYRFYNQKARYLFDFLSNDNTWNNHSFKDATEFRSWLLKVKGIGPKTASWIARNFLESDQVAILDIHLIRAFQIMKVFPLVVNIDKDYFHLEALFLDFCQALEVRPSVLDAVIWGVMKQTNRTGISILNQQFK